MALHHARPGEIVDVRPLGNDLSEAINVTLLRSEHLQVFRVVLPRGEEFSDHAVPGEITVQCLEGVVDFRIGNDKNQRLAAGHLLYLDGGQPHALKALEDASVLVTIYHPRHPDQPAAAYAGGEGPGAGSWVPEYTIYAPSGAVDAYGSGNANGCSISWVATETGTYIIAINEAGACGEANQIDNGYPEITCNGNVSVEETSALDFSIFPNPNNGQFVIDYSGASGMAQIDVLTISGKSVVSEQRMMNSNTQLDIDLGNGVSGMYFVRITMDEKSTVLKIIVN